MKLVKSSFSIRITQLSTKVRNFNRYKTLIDTSTNSTLKKMKFRNKNYLVFIINRPIEKFLHIFKSTIELTQIFGGVNSYFIGYNFKVFDNSIYYKRNFNFF